MALPSNYRKSEGDNRCDNCGYMEATGLCIRWNEHVEPEYLCDSWKPIEVIIDPPKGLTIKGTSKKIRKREK